MNFRALSFHQPWAWLVASGVKRVENRSRPPVGLLDQWIALHAAKHYDDAAAEYIRQQGVDLPTASRVGGAVIGVFCVDSYVADEDLFRRPDTLPADQRRWYFGPYGWCVRARLLPTPVPTRGQQMVWRLDEATSEAIFRQGVI